MNLKNLIGFEPPKNIDQLIKDSIRMDAPFQHFATVMVQDKEGQIKGISQSHRNNLILDNFGIWLAGFFRAVSLNTNTSVTLVGDDGANNEVVLYGSTTAPTWIFNTRVKTVGTHLHVGSGVTAATRADYDIETDLATAPESTFFDTGTGSYAAGAIAVAGAISAGGAGTINEVGLFGCWWEETGDVEDDHMLFHDILAAGEAFVLGETITVTYTISL